MDHRQACRLRNQPFKKIDCESGGEATAEWTAAMMNEQMQMQSRPGSSRMEQETQV